MRIIPAIDIIDGKCVRLTKGDYTTQKTYSTDPVAMAKSFEDAGIAYLHLVDLDGAKSNRIINYKVLNAIASQTGLKIDFGGGLKSNTDLEIAFDNGANQITAGSIAITAPLQVQEWIRDYGPGKIILGADCQDRKIALHGWQEKSDLDVLDFIRHYQKHSVCNVICTDISKDGMLEGPAFDLYTEIITATGIQLTASGGIHSLEDLIRLQTIGCEGAIIGKAIYEGYITLKELSTLC